MILASLYALYIAVANMIGALDTRKNMAQPASIQIGNQVWMAENLSVTLFRNGDSIPNITHANSWSAAGRAGKPAWSIYGNASQPKLGYGLLYNYAAVADARGLCPAGWQIPSKSDWAVLEKKLGAIPVRSLRRKADGQIMAMAPMPMVFQLCQLAFVRKMDNIFWETVLPISGLRMPKPMAPSLRK